MASGPHLAFSTSVYLWVLVSVSLFYLCPTPAASSQSSETPPEGGEGGASAWPWREGPLPARLLPSVQLPTAPLSGLLGITGDAV